MRIMLFPGIAASLLFAAIGASFIAIGASGFGWAVIAVAVVIAITVWSLIRYDHREGLAFVDVEGDSGVGYDRGSWKRAWLHANDVEKRMIRVGYVHWFAELASHDFTVGVGPDDAVYVIENASKAKYKGKYSPNASEISHLSHI